MRAFFTGVHPVIVPEEHTPVWAGLAFGVSLLIAAGAVTHFGAPAGIYLALRATARFAFLLFLPAYVGGALVSLFGPAFLPLKERARRFGLAFAAAMVVHFGLVTWLCAIGQTPPIETFVVFGFAALCTVVLTLFSFRWARDLTPKRLWPPIRAFTTTYIMLAFIDDFRYSIGGLSHTAMYLPFLVLGVGGLLVRLVALAQVWPIVRRQGALDPTCRCLTGDIRSASSESGDQRAK